MRAGGEPAVPVKTRVAASSGVSDGAGNSVGSGVSLGARVAVISTVGVGETCFEEQAERVNRARMAPRQPNNLIGLRIFSPFISFLMAGMKEKGGICG